MRAGGKGTDHLRCPRLPDPNEQTPEQQQCMACRGSGTVLAQQDDALRPQPCPWCDGSGMRIAEHDAQARWREASAD